MIAILHTKDVVNMRLEYIVFNITKDRWWRLKRIARQLRKLTGLKKLWMEEVIDCAIWLLDTYYQHCDGDSPLIVIRGTDGHPIGLPTPHEAGGIRRPISVRYGVYPAGRMKLARLALKVKEEFGMGIESLDAMYDSAFDLLEVCLKEQVYFQEGNELVPIEFIPGESFRWDE